MVDKFLYLLVGPTAPQSFDDVVFRSKLSGPRGKLFQSRKAVVAAIDITPYRQSWRDPRCVHPLWKKCRARRRTEVRDDVTVHERVQVAPCDHDPPRCRDRPDYCCGPAEPFGL